MHKVSIFQHPQQYLCLVFFFFFFLITAIPVGIKQHVILAFICICLMINNAVHLLMCLLATRMPSLENVHSSPVPGFELDCFVVVEL